MKTKLFGFGFVVGRVKRRVALKHLRRRWTAEELKHAEQFSDYKIGDVVNDCSAYNGVILDLTPEYWPPFKGARFEVLWDVSLFTSNTGASFRNCGIEAKLARAEIIKRYPDLANSPKLGPEGEMIPPNNLPKT